MAVEDDDSRLATRGEVRLLRKEVKYWVVIGLIGGQTLAQVAISFIGQVDPPTASEALKLVSSFYFSLIF